ncbi:dienelactone hydrolase family protein [uncultured Pseudoteredinibacter sp.]|uniref:alpha/beta fold hydrolase n=1 Tax=uncultured Pseudoteredinibacter sp. TaxID=1641701 RepID=UPI00262ABBAA|nr:dienelactone hydrolase family protein [uncultured Pseudoteredinibacter sp.]
MSLERYQSAFIVLWALIAQGCGTQPFNYDEYVDNNGLNAYWQDGSSFRHWLVEKKGVRSNGVLRVYIGGDGTPWLLGRYVNDDPTPLNPIALKLMKYDSQQSLYLGRPCYHGLEAACNNSLWTSARYSREVVDSMVSALEGYLSDRAGSEKGVELVGYSGGGALAMLLASRVDAVTKVVTVAGNLDHFTWTKRLSYLPLHESLNPIDQAPLVDVDAVHIIGREDRNILAATVKEFVSRKGGKYIELDGFDHSCCWETAWPSLLNEIDKVD